MTDKLWQSAAAGIPGAGLLVWGWSVVDNIYFRAFLFFSGGILLALAVAILLVWLAYQAAEVRHDFVRANAWNSEIAMLHERGNLADKLRGVDELTKKIIIESGMLGVSFGLFDDEPRVSLSDEPPYWFFYEFIEKSNSIFLYQINNYSDKSKERRWTKQLTDYFIHTGRAEVARGNQQARWKSPQIFEQYKLLAKHEETQPPLRESEPV